MDQSRNMSLAILALAAIAPGLLTARAWGQNFSPTATPVPEAYQSWSTGAPAQLEFPRSTLAPFEEPPADSALAIESVAPPPGSLASDLGQAVDPFGEDCPSEPGLLARWCGLKGACWTLRGEGMVLWRSNPQPRPLFSFWTPPAGPVGPTALDASQLNSDVAAGPYVSLLRDDGCDALLETTYFQASEFTAARSLPATDAGYTILPLGIYANTWTDLDTASAALEAAIQSLEVNARFRVFPHVQLLVGFRWVEWDESFTAQDSTRDPANPADPPTIDIYGNSCTNSLYGGQLGADVRLVNWRDRIRFDGIVKAGGYGNVAGQISTYQYGNGPFFATSAAADSTGFNPAFVGEAGLNGAIALTPRIDLTFGYMAIWLQGLAQPTNQLSGQVLTQLPPSLATIDLSGETVVQGFRLGLQGRW
jgi:hypothetical protein